MRKVLFSHLLFVLFFSSLKSFSQTNVGGTLTSDTNWTKENSPYTLTSTLGVLSGVTLSIEAGVEIYGDHDLLVKGNIVIQGNETDSVLLKQTRLLFKSTNLSNSTIEYVNFFSGLQLADEREHNQDNPKNSGTLVVKNSGIKNGYARTKGYDSNAKLRLENCVLVGSNVKGYYPRSEPIEIISSSISGTTINSDSYNFGIFLRDSDITVTSPLLGLGSNINYKEIIKPDLRVTKAAFILKGLCNSYFC